MSTLNVQCLIAPSKIDKLELVPQSLTVKCVKMPPPTFYQANKLVNV